jgi:hypothetical protein
VVPEHGCNPETLAGMLARLGPPSSVESHR